MNCLAMEEWIIIKKRPFFSLLTFPFSREPISNFPIFEMVGGSGEGEEGKEEGV